MSHLLALSSRWFSIDFSPSLSFCFCVWKVTVVITARWPGASSLGDLCARMGFHGPNHRHLRAGITAGLLHRRFAPGADEGVRPYTRAGLFCRNQIELT
jgi:hypothetical protein